MTFVAVEKEHVLHIQVRVCSLSYPARNVILSSVACPVLSYFSALNH